MSMFWLWDQLLGDPDRVEREERAREVARAPRDEDDAAPPELVCRVCQYAGPERYCPRCLADTMRALRPLRR
jgi:hypothetical protein